MSEKIWERLIGVGCIIIGIAIGAIFYEIPNIKYDLNGDGYINSEDVLKIQSYIEYKDK